MLDIINSRRQRAGLDNVQTVLGTVTDTGLPEASVDLALIVDAYHEFEYPFEMGMSMARALKPGGLLVLIEYRMEDPAVPIKSLHKMSQEQAKAEMAAPGPGMGAHRRHAAATTFHGIPAPVWVTRLNRVGATAPTRCITADTFPPWAIWQRP